jgi:hypothetical protein
MTDEEKEEGNLPAFPSIERDELFSDGRMNLYDRGITIRDYFAAKALSGMSGLRTDSPYHLASSAYDVADAMLEERNKKPL